MNSKLSFWEAFSLYIETFAKSKLFLLATICFLSLLFLNSNSLQAQTSIDSTSVFQIETTDGNTYTGKMIAKDESNIRFKTTNLGEINISIINIRNIKKIEVSSSVNGELWFENPHATRYFYLPNGYGLKKDEGYYQNAWVLFNQFSYGFSNHFSLGIGMIPTFLFGTTSFPLWITPKLSFPIKKDAWNVGVGALMGTVFGESTSTAGLVYGVSTFGSKDKNFTLGAGYGFMDKEWTKKPMISMAGLVRTGKKHYLMTEDYLFFNENSFLLLMFFGGRIVNPHLAVDYGLIFPTFSDMDTFIAIPWLSITVPFGGKPK